MKKHTTYLILTTLLRLLLSFALHAAILIKRGNRTVPGEPVRTRWVAFPTRAQLSVIVTGIVAGYLIGKRRWHIVYVEKRHRSMRGNK